MAGVLAARPYQGPRPAARGMGTRASGYPCHSSPLAGIPGTVTSHCQCGALVPPGPGPDSGQKARVTCATRRPNDRDADSDSGESPSWIRRKLVLHWQCQINNPA